ncbi:Retrovirus-related Pol polyprotein from transposon 297 [Araneus ventricosus]|uniref:RNA-directed DNA polymerase n=1 Tax=Araneus ventricosus TaxID=182803 RepID=A0A4Y2S382_ARAVE|nr:Retrovirus-related Pol polyprotein from transposon 297 [Araneus ventricosus]GBN82582.1 Retrovirus-related Pol polyprotein from transposon 297 [Araneus ventricosus]GBN82594.1 Retrovirus-related Pol polyprotein from transposon 297 [Araneus ventricosus]
MVLADGKERNVEALTTTVNLNVEGKIVRVKFIALPEAKGNRTLLGTDFLQAAAIVLNIQNGTWHFSENPHKQFSFYKNPSDVKENLPTISSHKVTSPETIPVALPETSLPVILREDEGKHLTSKQRDKFNSLLKEFETCFHPGGDPTPFIEPRIQTGNNLPVSEPPYRMTPAKKELLKKELESLLPEGIIEECESPYASPVVLVPKPNGSIRLCIDYRKLNATTIPDTYPLPRMDDLLNEAKSTKFMSTIDLKAGYHQDVFALSYLDDIIVLSENFDKHLSDLRQVFERLSLFKLTANRNKCNFACNRVKYLGHYITEQGIEVDADKVSSVQKITEPTCVKEVQSYLQTCSWFRRYDPHFSEIARPLSDLTKKNKTWAWGEPERKAFESLKKVLISPPVLSQPDGSKPFIIRTDASSYALGAVLIQGEKPEEHVIEYASRLMSSAERNYSTTEREALAVVWALEKFRGYVENQEIIIASDHQPLKWLMSIKSLSGRLARWALQIQSFHPKILYTPGKSNVVADLLSRPVHDNKEFVCNLNTISIELPSRRSRYIREEQMKDEDMKKIIDCFESGRKDEDFINWTSRGYLMNQGILYRYSPDTESEEAQLVVPCHERERVLQQYHDSPTAGHSGSEGTFETLAIDLFGPLPETPTGKKWIFLIEDTSTKWVELFALEDATAQNCAKFLIEEVFLRYGLPRRLISDNGTQFVSAVMQQTCNFLGIKQELIPVYHPQANPSERKNRDLKPKLAILVGDAHDTWDEKLAMIRLKNTSKCDTTGHTAAYLQFGRELRTTDDVNHDLRSLIENDNFVAEITPYLKHFARLTPQIRERVEQKQDQRKKYFDKNRRPIYYQPGDKVWVTLHPKSSRSDKRSKKFYPKREGPYLVVTNRSPTTSDLSDPSTRDKFSELITQTC